jgi:hypothetical protein
MKPIVIMEAASASKMLIPITGYMGSHPRRLIVSLYPIMADKKCSFPSRIPITYLFFLSYG